MTLFFPAELLACIGEARPPTDEEVAVVADKIWHEALAHRGVEPARAMDVARAALAGAPFMIRS